MFGTSTDNNALRICLILQVVYTHHLEPVRNHYVVPLVLQMHAAFDGPTKHAFRHGVKVEEVENLELSCRSSGSSALNSALLMRSFCSPVVKLRSNRARRHCFGFLSRFSPITLNQKKVVVRGTNCVIRDLRLCFALSMPDRV